MPSLPESKNEAPDGKRPLRPLDWYGFSEEALVRIAREAGEVIMAELNRLRDLPPEERATCIFTKPDGSRVTTADFAADRYLREQLGRIGVVGDYQSDIPHAIPVMSEEMALAEQQAISHERAYWCIDPLDGTSNAIDYIEGRGNRYFGVLIGLAKDGVPLAGVNHYPLMGTQSPGLTYYSTADGRQAFRKDGEAEAVEIRVAKPALLRPWRLASREHGPAAALGGHAAVNVPIVGNRLLAIAEGVADAAVVNQHSLQPSGYWDEMGPQAVLCAAGGEYYHKPDLAGRKPLHGAPLVRYPGTEKPYQQNGFAASGAVAQALGAPAIARAR